MRSGAGKRWEAHCFTTSTCLVRPCAGGSWAQPSIGLLNHGARGRTPVYLWVIGMAVCGDKDMAALATICTDNLKVCGPFLVC